MCPCRCSKPYYGGQRACGAGEAANGNNGNANGNGAANDPNDLQCGECSARAAGQNCPKHGTAYIEWKCERGRGPRVAQGEGGVRVKRAEPV